MASEEYFSAHEEDNAEDIPVFNIYDKIIDKKDDNTFFIKLSFRELIAYTGYWCYNRTICEAKVDELYRSLCDSTSDYASDCASDCYNIPFILHAIYDEKHSDQVRRLLILDGQHRREAIKKYIETHDKGFTCTHHVWVCVYKFSHSETRNTEKIIELFKKINSNRIFDVAELPDTFIIDLVKAVCEIPLFKKNKVIGTNVMTNTCHAPCIHKKELNALFTKHADIIKSAQKTIPELVANIQTINHKISLKSYDELYNPSQRNAEKVRYQKAVTKGFFLNLKNSKYTSDVWIKYMNEPENLI